MYAPTYRGGRIVFFESIVQFVGQWGCQNFIIFRDFNAMFSMDERWRIDGSGPASKEFVSLVNSLGL